jgi:hypothetical protein
LIERVTKVFQPKKVILMSSPEVISRYSLNAETYRKIAKNFAIQIDHAIAELQAWETDYAGVLQVDFIQIMEGATLLGAERLLAALEEASPSAGSPPLNPLQVASLEKELQLVRKALSIQIG